MQQVATLGLSGGFNTDINKAFLDKNTYLEAVNFTATPTGGSTLGALENVKGNELISELSFGTDQEIVGYANVVSDIVFFTTDGTDSLIHLYSDSTLATLYNDSSSTSKLSFSQDSEYRITGVGREETSTIRKVYWVDGLNVLRYIDLDRDYTDIEATAFNVVPTNDITLTLDQEIINGSGSYTAGTVYHAYQFYTKNGASSTVSQASMPILLSEYSDLKDGGTDVDEDSNCSVKVTISDIPDAILDQYNRIRLYAIFYGTYGSDPEVNIVSERSVSSDSIIILDTGSYDDESTLAEFLVLNQTSYIPQTIASKDNYLFIGNLKEATFTSDAIDEWDSRAYRFNSSSVCNVYDTSESNEITVGTDFLVSATTYSEATVGDDVPEDFDCFNTYNNIYETTLYDKITNDTDYRYKSDGATLGGEGLNVSYEFVTDDRTIDSNATAGAAESSTFVVTNQDNYYDDYGNLVECEDGEVYRVGIRFFNKEGQSSFVKWIGDVLWEEDLNNRVNSATAGIQTSTTELLKISIASLPDDDDITSYQIVRAARDTISKSIIASGLLQPITDQDDDDIYTPSILNALSAEADTPVLYRFIAPNIMFNSGGDATISNYKFRTYNKVVDRTSEVQYFGDDSQQRAYGIKYTTIESLETTTTNAAFGNLTTIVDAEYADPEYKQDDESDTTITVSGYQYRNQQGFDDSTTTTYGAGCSTYIVSLTDTIYLEDDDVTDTTSVLYTSLLRNNTLTRYGGSSYQDILNSEYIPFSNVYDASPQTDFQVTGSSTSGSSTLTDMTNTSYFTVGDYVTGVTTEGVTLFELATVESIDLTNSTITISEELTVTDTFIVITKIKYNDTYCIYGDVYTTPFYFMNLLYYDDDDTDNDSAFCMTSFPVTSTIDLRRRSDRILDFYTGTDDISGITDDDDIMQIAETTTEGISLQADVYDTDIGDLYTYNTAFSCDNTSMMSYPKPFDFDADSVITTKILASDNKTNGESEDNWTNFSSGDFIEVDSAFGGLNDLMTMDSKLFFWQDKGFGIISTSDRSLISDDSGSQLSLGTGDLLQRYDYISTDVGNQDKYSISKSDNALFWFYSPRNTIYRYNGNLEEISTSKWISNYLSENTTTDPISIPDFLSKETVFKVGDNVLVFDWLNDKFTGVYSFTPTWFIPEFDGGYISSGDDQTVYRHNSDDVIRGTFYGTANNSTIKHVCNVDYDISKVFDVLSWHSTSTTDDVNQFSDTFTNYRIYNDYQNTDWQTISWTRPQDSFQTYIPRDRVNQARSSNPDIFDDDNLDSTQTFKRRIRDKYIVIDLEYVNIDNTTFSIPYINVGYRSSKR